MENNRRTRLLNVARTSFQLRPFDRRLSLVRAEFSSRRGKQRGLGRGVATNGEQCRAQRGWIIFHGFGTIAPRWRCVRFFQTGIRVPPPCDARVMVGASREMEFSNQLLTFFFCFVSFRSIFKACLVQDIAL